jgi:hypothetical protein
LKKIQLKREIKKIAFVYYLVGICLSSCNHAKPGISQLWFYTYSSDSLTDKNNLTPANFLELRPDGLFTSDLGKFRSGRWFLKDQQLFLKGDDGSENILFINELQSAEMQVRIGQADAANFDGSSLPEKIRDPFSKANNQWRIPPDTKETDTQIRARLRNHCGFWVNYFTWALDKELSTVDVRSTPTPIKIYGNGFSIKRYNDLPETWKKYFYDSADCARSNEMLVDLVSTHTIAWPHTENKYKMFISAFQQMGMLLR